MASIQCSSCKHGIHYHGEPNGICYIIIETNDWKEIISSAFDAKSKIFDAQGQYPKLFRSDSIEEDFPDAVKKCWKCPKCGTLMLFDIYGKITGSYAQDNNLSLCEAIPNFDGVIFDDYQWDKITESSIPNGRIPDYFTPTAHIQMYINGEITVTGENSILGHYHQVTTEQG